MLKQANGIFIFLLVYIPSYKIYIKNDTFCVLFFKYSIYFACSICLKSYNKVYKCKTEQNIKIMIDTAGKNNI